MVDIINEHARHGLRDGRHVCHAKGCDKVYEGEAYPESIVVTAHVVGQLRAAGFGSMYQAWGEGVQAGHDGVIGKFRKNPYTKP
jgi:hypothetical protein